MDWAIDECNDTSHPVSYILQETNEYLGHYWCMLVPQEISHLQIGRWHLLWDWKLQKRGGITKSGVPFMGGSQTNFQDGIRTGISFFNIKRFLCLCRFPFNIHPIMRQIVMDGKIYSRAIWHLQLSVYVMIYFRRNLRDPNYCKCHFMEMSIHELTTNKTSHESTGWYQKFLLLSVHNSVMERSIYV